MSREEIVQFWGNENLRQWTVESVGDLRIPASSKTFLVEVGLPIEDSWTLQFGPTDRVPKLGDDGRYRQIGVDDVVPICLDEEGGGQVIANETTLGGPERYVNASVEQFGEFLVHYERYRRAARTVAEEDIQEVIESTKASMLSIDDTAFASPENWWPVIIEQMIAGML